MSFKYVAAVPVFVTVTLVPLDAPCVPVTYQPLVFLNVTLVSAVQSQNAKRPIDVTLFPIVTLASEVQRLNTELPIDVTLSGITIFSSEVQ